MRVAVNQPTDPKFDLRTLSRALREGKIERKEYEAYLKSLPDDGKNAAEVIVFEEETNKKSLAFS